MPIFVVYITGPVDIAVQQVLEYLVREPIVREVFRNIGIDRDQSRTVQPQNARQKCDQD